MPIYYSYLLKFHAACCETVKVRQQAMDLGLLEALPKNFERVSQQNKYSCMYYFWAAGGQVQKDIECVR